MSMSKIKYAFIFMMMIGAGSLAIGQSSSGSGGHGGGAPIDGGITLLVGGIAAYGVKKLRDNHKKAQANPEV
jgi:hypothetical protein